MVAFAQYFAASRLAPLGIFQQIDGGVFGPRRRIGNSPILGVLGVS
jgi:hypothetical protein